MLSLISTEEEKVSGLFFGTGRGGERAFQQLHGPFGHGVPHEAG
jgi:hypothetical protein